MAQCVRHEFLARPARVPFRAPVRWGALAACAAVLFMGGGHIDGAAAQATAHHHAHHAKAAAGAAVQAKSAHAGKEKKAHAAGTHHHHHAAAAAGAAVTTGAVGAAAVAGSAPPPAAHAAAPVPDAPAALAPVDNTKGSVTGLPLPRFAAFRADEVNLRTGPGQRYPIDWVYHRRGLPVKIEREFDVWRLVEDSDGQKGWVHQATLVGTRTFVIPGLPPQGDAQQAGQPTAKETDVIGRADTRIVGHVADVADAADIRGAVMLRSDASTTSPVVAVLRPGVVGTLRQCQAGTSWCKVSVKQYSGWLERSAMWGLLPQEVISPS
ncbi:SH3 domain-containing protein [Komagataeibacter diospyri]|uniref:Aspartyl-tRNA synthetase n=1 Tax=Komagataeibacter diospyri TaxID=1932662 RepID=A0A4P5NQS5_9PROT|nr:SH3 domain-containing protein [Komagataeibacter diospyri]GCE84000.1 aspartyl-tRNA synthetase [Komagataeibacter diospyri]